MKKGEQMSEDDKKLEISVMDKFNPNKQERSFFVHELPEDKEDFLLNITLYRASDRVRQKMGNSAVFSREIVRQERSIMRQIMRFFKS